MTLLPGMARSFVPDRRLIKLLFHLSLNSSETFRANVFVIWGAAQAKSPGHWQDKELE